MVTVKIGRLVEIVSRGGTLRTGVDVFNDQGLLLLAKDSTVDSITPLLFVKRYRVGEVPIDVDHGGGLWDEMGQEVYPEGGAAGDSRTVSNSAKPLSLEQRVEEIVQLKEEAADRYKAAKNTMKQVIGAIRKSGEFDHAQVDQTVSELIGFLARRDSAFSYLTREIFSYEDYLLNHAVNVCTIGTSILKRFNDHFGEVINRHLSSFSNDGLAGGGDRDRTAFIYYLPDDIHHIAMGYFLHDIGTAKVPEEILNKNGPLTPEEYETVKRHSLDFGEQILRKSAISNPYVENTVLYHHVALYNGESRSYPEDRLPIEVPPYVKVCKLADVYDAMTSKRSYREARNPIEVVTEIFRSYANKNRMLQFLLYSFVKSIGIYPPGSVLFMRNGQMAYVLESEGPIVLPFTDTEGVALKGSHDPMDLGSSNLEEDFQIDRRRPLKSPEDAFEMLPEFLRNTS